MTTSSKGKVTELLLGAGVVAIIVAGLASSDAALFTEVEDTPLYRDTLERTFSRFKQSDFHVSLAGRAQSAWADVVPDGAAAIGPVHTHDGPPFQDGDRLKSEGQYDEAIASYGQAFGEDPRCSLAKHRIADCLVLLGRDDEAVKAYRDALQFKPDYPCVYEHIAEIMARRGHDETAAQMMQNALDGYRSLGRQPGAAGEEARSDLIVFFHKYDRDLTEALTVAQELVEESPLPRHLVLLARALEKLGREVEAAAVIRRLIAASPELTEHHEAYLASLEAAAARTGETKP